MKKDIELIKRYPPWRESQIGFLKVGGMILGMGLLLFFLIIFIFLDVSSFFDLEYHEQLLVVGSLLVGIPFTFLLLIVGTEMFFGTLAESISDSIALWKYNRGIE